MAEEKEDILVDVKEAYSKTEHYLEQNKRSLAIILGAVVVLIAGYFVWQKLFVAPQEQEARSEMFMAEKYFEKDSLDKAINGDGKAKGFKYIIEEYSITKSANLAHYYLGISYLRKGKFEDAVKELNEFETDDEILGPIAIGAMGDAYMEMDKKDEAVSHYLKAAKEDNNKFTAPIYLMKAAVAYEELKNFENAIKIYEQIKADYSDSPEGRDIDRFLERAKALSGK
jgi:tetratricopeptide (TPR) repeat protein